MRDQTNFFLFLGVYSIVTFLLFHLVYNTSKQVIDEEFHLRQGEHYCRGRFHIVSVASVILCIVTNVNLLFRFSGMKRLRPSPVCT